MTLKSRAQVGGCASSVGLHAMLGGLVAAFMGAGVAKSFLVMLLA
jgi:hypothetical protein